MGKKLVNLDTNFRKHHYEFVDRINKEVEELLRLEQQALSNYDHEVENLNI